MTFDKKKKKPENKGWMPNEPTLAFILAVKKKLEEKSTDFDRTKVIFDPPSYREAAYCKSVNAVLAYRETRCTRYDS